MPDPALVLEGVERRYGDRLALAGVSLTLAAGQTLAVFGSNGAGKTTLLRILATLLRPHGGQVDVLGARIPQQGWKIRGRIGYLAHDPLLYRDLTVRENLRFHARLHRIATARVDELIEAIGLERRDGDLLSELSRGMVQRVAVARAVLHDPSLILLDEPRAGLDPSAAAALEPLIGRSSGRTRVLVSHDVEGAISGADCALGLRGGRQVFFGAVTAAEVRRLYE